MGRFIVLEGGDASGKSTQARILAERLGAVLTHEPGATSLGRELRRLLLDPESPPVAARAEALLMAADRAQHVAEIVQPALDAGRDVVSDRFTGSSLVYQGAGRGLDVDAVAALSTFAAAGLEPDVVILLDVDATHTVPRRSSEPDRIEREDEGFHQRVVDGYRDLAAADPKWVLVDGRGTVEEVAARVWKAAQM
jgi:dTMP kinase